MYRAVILVLALTCTPAVARAQQPCTSDAQQVVNELYRHMLERSPDPGSVHWVQQLESGQMNVREVVRQIAKSQEHTQRFHYTEAGEGTPYERSVARLYRHLLGRQPDPDGQRAHAELAQRSGADAVVDRIINSNEYNQQFGDWGVAGSGGIRYCAPGNRTVSQETVAPVAPDRRFGGLDRNNDGVITRNEWRGSRQAFDNQDWNNDGVLSGDEIDGGATRFGRPADDREARRAQRFDNLDVNGNNRIEPREWDGTVAAFNRLDVNNDNILSRAELVDGGFAGTSAVATSGDMFRVNARERWTDTGINVRAGDTLVFDAQGTVRLSDNGNDIAGAGGALSGRRAPDAPLLNQLAGALIGRIGAGNTFFIGNRRSLRAPVTGRLYLGVNDDHLADNTGDFQVLVTVQGQ